MTPGTTFHRLLGSSVFVIRWFVLYIYDRSNKKPHSLSRDPGEMHQHKRPFLVLRRIRAFPCTTGLEKRKHSL